MADFKFIPETGDLTMSAMPTKVRRLVRPRKIPVLASQ